MSHPSVQSMPPGTQKPRRLSKSRVMAGLQCHKLLWWRTHEPDSPELVPDAGQQAIFDRGNRIGEVAQSYVPGGTLIPFNREDMGQMVTDTAAALKAGATVIYEASFAASGVFVSVDILEKIPGGWGLIEVKSATRVKPPNIPDAACQTHVLREAGIPVTRVELMHLNRACTYPDLSDLFTRTDVTAEVERALPTMPDAIARQAAMLGGPRPDVEIGDHCNSPYTCSFQGRCWPPEPPLPIASLHRGGKKIHEFKDRGITTLDQIPPTESLKALWSRQREAAVTGEVVVAKGLKGEVMRNTVWPMAFLDFEAVQPAIPVWDGCHPYDQIAVQFSCHLLQSDGTLTHHEHVANGPRDPRPAIAEALVDACEGMPVVWTYYMSYERDRIRELQVAVPMLRDRLKDLESRLRDLLPVIRNHVYHPDFNGSFSIKAVLPALVPSLSYKALDIGDGQTASRTLESLLLGDPGLAKEDITETRRQLLEYCKLDTLAMVRLWEILVEFVK